MDIYAGTGAVGIEALEPWRAARNLHREEPRGRGSDSRKPGGAGSRKAAPKYSPAKPPTVLERARADIAFLDPPYELSKEYEASMIALDRSETALVIVQHSSRFTPQEQYGGLRRYRAIKQGDNSLSFYRKISTNSTQPLKTEKTKTVITPPATQ